MTYKLIGADKETGKDRSMRILAANAEEAIAMAGRKGLLVSEYEAVGRSLWPWIITSILVIAVAAITSATLSQTHFNPPVIPDSQIVKSFKTFADTYDAKMQSKNKKSKKSDDVQVAYSAPFVDVVRTDSLVHPIVGVIKYDRVFASGSYGATSNQTLRFYRTNSGNWILFDSNSQPLSQIGD